MGRWGLIILHFFYAKTILAWSMLLQWLEQVTPMVGASYSNGWSELLQGLEQNDLLNRLSRSIMLFFVANSI